MSIRSLAKFTLWLSDNVSQIFIPRQVAGTPRPPSPLYYVRYMQYRLFLGGQNFFTLRLASYSKVWFATRYTTPYQVLRSTTLGDHYQLDGYCSQVFPWPSDNVSQIPRQAAGTPRPPSPLRKLHAVLPSDYVSSHIPVYVRRFADLTFYFSPEVYDLFQLLCVLSFVLFDYFSLLR